jgi:hypothetical protein
LVFQNLIEMKRVPPSLNTEECNTWTFCILWMLFVCRWGCRVRFILVYFGMQLNIKPRKSVKNFAKHVVFNLPFCMLVISSAVCFESVVVLLMVTEKEEWRY